MAEVKGTRLQPTSYMKRILPFAAAAAAIAIPLVAATLPFAETFDSNLGEFTTIDANQDGNTFSRTTTYGNNWTGGVQYTGNANPADEWLVMPSFELQKGFIYELSYQYKVSSSNNTYTVEWKAGTAATADAMTISVAAPQTIVYEWGAWKTVTTKVTVPEDGTYFIGMHLSSEANQGTVYFDNISLSAGVNGAAPVTPTVQGPAFAIEGEKLQTSFGITLPTETALGESLGDNELTVSVSRDGSELSTLTGQPGATLTFTDEDAPLENCVYSFTCALGDAVSPAVTVDATPRFGTPKAVENLTVVRDGDEFTISWDAVTEAASSSDLIFPSMVTYTVKCGTEVIVEKTSELTTHYTATMPEDGQEAISFNVVAFSHNGRQSALTYSDTFMVGNPYTGQFAESFASAKFERKTWVAEGNNVWKASVGQSYPTIDPQDGDGGCLEFYTTSAGEYRITSPVIDMSGLVNAKLKFWVYLDNTSYYEPKIQPAFLTDGEELMLGDVILLKSGSEKGWTEFTFDVPEQALTAPSQLMFIGFGGTYGHMFVDNISIRSYLDHNLAVTAKASVKSFEVGQEVEIPVTVTNKGVNDEAEYTLRLFADGEEVAVLEGPAVSSLSSVNVTMPYKVHPKHAEQEILFYVAANLDSDGDQTDNEYEFSVPVNANDLARATELTATADKEKISLTWSAPDVSTEPTFAETTESFEDWEAGSTEPRNGWVFIDADGVKQYGLNGVNAGELFAATVMENFTAANSWDPSMTSHDGNHSLVITPAQASYGNYTSSSTAVDNWIISPEVKGGSEVSFYCMTFTSYSGSESYQILYSTGETTADDFTVLSTEYAPREWTLKTFTLPEDAKRFAIRINHGMSNPLLFDSFTFTTISTPAVHQGFNLYRDHVLLTSLASDETSHVDLNAIKGVTHTYHVTALYDKGESHYSEPVEAALDIEDGIDMIDADEGVETYYDLNGIRITKPAKGQTVIVRKGSESYKTIWK